MEENTTLEAPDELKKLEITAESASFEGPIPPPSILAKYEDIEPGLAAKIFAMAESEANHRHKIEQGVLEANRRTAGFNSLSEIIGSVFGFLIGIVSIAAGTFLAINGKEGAGSFIGSAGVIGLVAVFVMGRQKSKDSSEKEH